MKKLLRSRTEPAQWTPEHERLRASLEKLGIKRERPFPEWLVVEVLIEDVDGGFAGVEVRRAPVLSSHPSPTVEFWATDDADGEETDDTDDPQK